MRTECYLQILEQVCTLIQRVYQLQTMQPKTKEENFHSMSLTLCTDVLPQTKLLQ